MTASTRIFCAGAFAALLVAPVRAESRPEPDALVLRNGAEIRGLIVRNSATEVTIQTPAGEETYRKSEIGRILDAGIEGKYLTLVERPGSLPPWRTFVNDLRHNDGVRSFEQIPATVIDEGVFKNVPYLSFRVNGFAEFNVYGDPDDPSGIEIGLYGAQFGNRQMRRMAREFFASYLNRREEIAALYDLDEAGGKRDVGPMTIEFTPASAPDAQGAWWISIYNRAAIEKARLSAAEYARLTRPIDEVLDRRGNVRATAWDRADQDRSIRLKRDDDADRLFLRGFYRDESGTFRLLPAPGSDARPAS